MISLLRNIVNLSALCIWGYTIYLAYTLSGVLAAILSAAFPFLAQIYWIYDRWSVTDEFFNLYTIVCLSWLAPFLLLVFAPKDNETG